MSLKKTLAFVSKQGLGDQSQCSSVYICVCTCVPNIEQGILFTSNCKWWTSTGK